MSPKRLRSTPEPAPEPAAASGLDVPAFLHDAEVPHVRVTFTDGARLFAQGARASSVFYITQGAVKLSVLSSAGKEAVVAMLGAGDFVGEGCLAGQLLRMGTATSLGPTAALRILKPEMVRLLRSRPEFSGRFIEHMLMRNIRIEEDLVDQLFNSSEKRLARTLLLLARYGHEEVEPRELPKLSQETLAEMVGTTRSRVNFFMNKFRRLGFIKYDGGLSVQVHPSLVSVILHE